MNETPKSSPDTQFPIADAMLEIAEQETVVDVTGQTMQEAFEAFQRGELSGPEYAVISDKLAYTEAVAKTAVKKASERVNNDGKPLAPAQRIGQWLIRHKD